MKFFFFDAHKIAWNVTAFINVESGTFGKQHRISGWTRRNAEFRVLYDDAKVRDNDYNRLVEFIKLNNNT